MVSPAGRRAPDTVTENSRIQWFDCSGRLSTGLEDTDFKPECIGTVQHVQLTEHPHFLRFNVEMADGGCGHVLLFTGAFFTGWLWNTDGTAALVDDLGYVPAMWFDDQLAVDALMNLKSKKDPSPLGVKDDKGNWEPPTMSHNKYYHLTSQILLCEFTGGRLGLYPLVRPGWETLKTQEGRLVASLVIKSCTVS